MVPNSTGTVPCEEKQIVVEIFAVGLAVEPNNMLLFPDVRLDAIAPKIALFDPVVMLYPELKPNE